MRQGGVHAAPTIAARLTSAGLVLAALAGCTSDRADAPGTTHVLLVTLDTTRTDRLGCYGYRRATTPHLDRLAAQATVFEMAIAQAAVTPVSHASILTGREPYHHGLRVLHGTVANRLAEDRTTLAETWRRAGGQSAAFVSAYPAGSAFGLAQGFEVFDESFPHADGDGLVSERGIVNTESAQRRADETTRAAVRWLEEGRDPDRPLLMWVHYFDPHDVHLLPPREFVEEHAGRFPPSSPAITDRLRAVYDLEIRFMDEELGRLLAAFERHGLWDETLVAVVADHGVGLGDHDWWSHGILYQEQIHVPLILRVPGAEGGGRVPSLVRTIDLVPTALEAAGIDRGLLPAVDGESLLGCLETGRCTGSRLAYADSVNMLNYSRPDDGFDVRNDKLYALFDGTHKLIYHQLHPRRSELYDLASDPGELRNLGGGQPAQMRRLLSELEARQALSDLLPGATRSDEDRAEKLRALGYVD
jgi:arylsulfatase A-like enzyme